MKISQLMQPEVVVARETQSLKEAAAALVAHGISGMPVCSESGEVVGVLSEADVLYKERGRTEPRGGALAWLLEDDTTEARAKARARTVARGHDDPGDHDRPRRHRRRRGAADARAGRQQAAGGRGGRPAGRHRHASRPRARLHAGPTTRSRPRSATTSSQRVLWVSPSAFTVSVRDGEVELTGELETVAQVELLESLVERVPGVVSVRANVGHSDHDRVGGRR